MFGFNEMYQLPDVYLSAVRAAMKKNGATQQMIDDIDFNDISKCFNEKCKPSIAAYVLTFLGRAKGFT